MKTKTKVAYTDEERARITSELKHAAMALADFWDAMREAEHAHECLIEPDIELVPMLAGDFDIPAQLGNLRDEEVWEAFLSATE